jgi:hypothetical protein
MSFPGGGKRPEPDPEPAPASIGARGMSTATVFLVIGGIAMIVGIGMMVTAIRGGPGDNPKSTVLLIAGMMATAFGLLFAAFAIGSMGGAGVAG